MVRVRTYPDARAFLARAEPWLLREERRYGLLLGIAYQVLGGTHRYRAPIYWATIEEDSAEAGAVTGAAGPGGAEAGARGAGARDAAPGVRDAAPGVRDAAPGVRDAAGDASLIGCAFRTPPHQVGVTALPAAAIEPLVASLRETYLNLPGVAGPEATANAFADAWTARFGGKWWLEQRQRLHSLTRVVSPSAPASGALRLALAPDVPVVRAWMAGFIRETGARQVGADAAERLVEEGRLHIWVDGQPCCMVGAVRETPHTAGIGAVYTPPQFRHRGYASVAVATLSRLLLDSGRRSCFLYTDLANPVSNAIYARLGYEPLDDVVANKIL